MFSACHDLSHDLGVSNQGFSRDDEWPICSTSFFFTTSIYGGSRWSLNLCITWIYYMYVQVYNCIYVYAGLTRKASWKLNPCYSKMPYITVSISCTHRVSGMWILSIFNFECRTTRQCISLCQRSWWPKTEQVGSEMYIADKDKHMNQYVYGLVTSCCFGCIYIYIHDLVSPIL